MNSFEIEIGGQQNSRTVIRENVYGNIIKHKNTPNLLNCSASLPFWVAWKNGNVAMGYGADVYKSIIIEWTNPNRVNLNAISLCSTHVGGGRWAFNRASGKFLLFIITSTTVNGLICLYINIQTERQRDRETERERQRERDRDRERQRQTETDRQTDRQTEIQTDRERDTERGLVSKFNSIICLMLINT